MTVEERARRQYADERNLNARINLHRRFSTNPVTWARWLFDQMRLAEGARILELGAGTGLLWNENRDRLPTGLHLVFTDPSAGMLAAAKANLAGIPHVEVRQADASQIADADQTFDAVIANHMLYEVPDRTAVFSEVVRVLRPTGELYAATNGANHMRELDQLIGPARTPAAGIPTRFSLENGETQLTPFFGSVELRRHDNRLAVRELAAAMAYVRSLTLDLSEDEDGRIAEAIGEVIDREGAFNITRDSGLFICRQPRPAPG
ncbi:MAG: class I SAM-dependent methyltransferase [Candidatus Dormibacteraeota bacterium]|nr:class I SAM-dependent methyltransferase [Candidatus Dormibacteraeota bacterium]